MKSPVRHVCEVIEVTDRRRWNEAVACLPCGHVLQSYEWGEFKSRHGWTPLRLLFMAGGEPVAAASALLRRLPGVPWGVMYVPKGPALDYGDEELLAVVLGHLEAVAGEQRALFVKIDPDVTADRSAVGKALRRRGWRASNEQVQFRNTLLIDLRHEEDELLMAMKPKTRYNIRLAQRRGVEVHLGGLADLPLFYDMYAATSARDGFVIRPVSYYADAWRTFISGGLAQLFLARRQGETLGGLILFCFGERAWYMYGASTDSHRNLMPNQLLHWEAMRWARAQGHATYDMWGAPDRLDQSDRMWGVYRFKEGFGGEFTSHLGAYDFASARALYWLYTVVMPKYLDLLRRRHRHGTGGEMPGYG